MFNDDPSKLKPIVLHGGAIREGNWYLGVVAHDTDGLFAVDHRHHACVHDFDEEDSWTVTHIPSMFRLQRVGYTDAPTFDDAIRVAQGLYAEGTKRGFPFDSAEAEKIRQIYGSLSDADKMDFWSAVKEFKANRGEKR